MSNYNDALCWATAYCSKAEHCCSEIAAKLDRYELSDDELQRLLSFLKKEGYLDENRYARAYAMDQLRFAHWGRLKIAQSLRLKKIDEVAIQVALADIPQDEYMQVLRRLVDEKKKRITAKTPYEHTMKLLRFAYGRGFEPEHIRKCINLSDDF